MKITMVGMAVLGFVLMCSAVTIKYRDGHALVCDVLAKDDTNLIVRTIKGVQTNTWRQLTSESFKAVHPALYQRLTQQALDRKKQQDDEMNAKGMILVGGTWVSKTAHEEKLLARVRLSILITDSVGKYERQDNNSSHSVHKNYRRESCGVLRIKLDSLDHTRTHTLRVQYMCYVDTPNEDKIKVLNKDKKVVEQINKQHGAEFEYRTEPFYEYKDVLKQGWHYSGGGTRSKSDAKIEGWDIKLWLDEKLVYERTRGGKEEYFLVTKW